MTTKVLDTILFALVLLSTIFWMGFNQYTKKETPESVQLLEKCRQTFHDSLDVQNCINKFIESGVIHGTSNNRIDE